jgi:hypothetical protein
MYTLTNLLILFALISAYVLFNMYVTRRINNAYYLSEQRRGLHKKFIWIIPFLGPLLIRDFWKVEKKNRFETITKEQRRKQNGEFYESGIGTNGE